MIRKYNDNAAYEAAQKPSDESLLSLIDYTNVIRVDGVNVLTCQPK